MLNQYTVKNNFRFSDQQLSEVIQNFPSFQEDGQFSHELYQQILHSNRFTPQSFEEYQRTNSVVDQLRKGIEDSAFSISSEVNQLLNLQGQMRTFKYAVLQHADYLDESVVDQEDIQHYYEQNQESFYSKPRLKVDYIELSIEKLGKFIEPLESEIETIYEETRGRYMSPESRQASHILINVSSTADESEKIDKHNLASEIVDRARLGEDFAGLAAEYSDDPGSAQNGGDLGIIAKGQMVKPFEDAVYSMNLGEIAGPVETQYGFHIIKLTALRESEIQTLAEVRDEVEAEVIQQKAEDLYAELAESFKNLVFENSDDIHIAAEELDLAVETTDWFTIDAGEGIASESMVRRTAFSEDVLNEGLVSQAIEIGFDRLIAVQKTIYEPAVLRPLSDIKNEVVEILDFQNAQDKVFNRGAELLSTLQSEVDSIDNWHTKIESEGFKVKQGQGRKNDFAKELQYLVDSVFAEETPEQDKIKVGGVVLDNGDYVVYALESVKDGNPEDFEDAEKTTFQQRLLARDGFTMFNNFQQFLRNQSEVEVFEEQL